MPRKNHHEKPSSRYDDDTLARLEALREELLGNNPLLDDDDTIAEPNHSDTDESPGTQIVDSDKPAHVDEADASQPLDPEVPEGIVPSGETDASAVDADDDYEISDEECARAAAPHLINYLKEIDDLITADKEQFTAQDASNNKRWSLLRARRIALEQTGAYSKEIISNMSSNEIKLLFEAAYDLRRTKRKKGGRQDRTDEKPAASAATGDTPAPSRPAADEPVSPPAPRPPRRPKSSTPLHEAIRSGELADVATIDTAGNIRWAQGTADQGGKFARYDLLQQILDGKDEREIENERYRRGELTVDTPPGGRDLTDDDDLSDKIMTPEQEAAYDECERAREDFAKLEARRQSRVGDYKGLRAIHGYNAARDAYFAARIKYGRLALADHLANETDPIERNALAIAYYLDEDFELRKLTNEYTRETRTQKFVNLMNRGGKVARFSKFALLGVVSSATAGVAAMGFGLIGAGIGAGVGAGAAAMTRFMRGYASANVRGMHEDTEEAYEGKLDHDFDQRMRILGVHGGDELQNASDIFAGYFSQDSRKEQGKNRKAVGYGIAGVAVGATLGHLLHMVYDSVASGHNVARAVSANPEPSQIPKIYQDATAQGYRMPWTGSGLTDPFEGPVNSPTPDIPLVTPDNPLAPAGPKLHDVLNMHDTLQIHRGEGWFETLQSMGVPDSLQQKVLQDAGPKLHEQGWAYFDKGEWRISHNGRLSESALATLKNSSAKFGYAFKR